MESENVNPPPSPSEKPTPNETIQNPINNQKGKGLIIGILVLICIIGGVAYYFELMNGKSASTQSFQKPTNPLANKIVTQTPPLPSPAMKSLPTAKAGFQQYTNDNLKFGFSYTASDSLFKCQDIPCLSMSRISLRVEALGTNQLDPNDVKASLMKADLYCSADGPEGSTSCQDIKVEDFSNSLGFKGYKVLRTKIVTGTGAGFPSGTYKDTAYVYLLPAVVKGRGISDYAAILFAVDNPSQTNLTELNTIADTFFTY